MKEPQIENVIINSLPKSCINGGTSEFIFWINWMNQLDEFNKYLALFECFMKKINNDFCKNNIFYLFLAIII